MEEQALVSAYISEARLYTSCELEIDDDPTVSIVDDSGGGNGAWIAGWIWVGHDDLPSLGRSG
jgi:hypothetical protein